jgi:hypothetical protein
MKLSTKNPNYFSIRMSIFSVLFCTIIYPSINAKSKLYFALIYLELFLNEIMLFLLKWLGICDSSLRMNALFYTVGIPQS